MKDCKELLIEKQMAINELLQKSQKNLAKYRGLPNKRIRSSTSNNCVQYYFVDPETGESKYAKNDEYTLVKKIIQRDYEVAVNSKLKKMEKEIEKTIKRCDFEDIHSIYNKLPLSKRNIVVPIVETDEMYIERWKLEHTGNQNTFFEDGKIQTNNGERVRSKSEKIIADLFEKYNVPYVYEPYLELSIGHIVYPDFAVLNVRERKTIYWEHLGLIDNEDYAKKNMLKIYDYSRSGYHLGENLILSMETSETPLNSKDVIHNIVNYCI